MKKVSLLAGLAALLALTAFGQDATGGQAPLDAQATAKKPQEQKAVVAPPPPGAKVGKKVTYGGYLTDLARAEKKRAMFSLRTPPQPDKDLENLWYYPGTDKIQGIVFFSFKF